MKRTVFFLSDHTGITVEAMGRSLLSQFEGFEYDTVHWPFIDSLDKVKRVVQRINQTVMESSVAPLVFSTLVDPELRDAIHRTGAVVHDFFETFTAPLEKELGLPSRPVRGYQHSMANHKAYDERIHAVNYALNNDDGSVTRNYDAADLILLGVSRSGKTPTCLYLGLQFGVLAANYPLTEDELEDNRLPKFLRPHLHKTYGLTIDPQQLMKIRQERRPTGRYSSERQCQWEVKQAEQMFQSLGIPTMNTTTMSIEEIATKLLHKIRGRRPVATG